MNMKQFNFPAQRNRKKRKKTKLKMKKGNNKE